MLETIIRSVLTGKLDPVLIMKWLNNESLEDAPDDCLLLCYNRNEFVAHFLSYLRNQTDSILQTNSNALQVLQHQSTPEKLLSARKHHRSISDPTSEADRSMDNLSVKTDQREPRSHQSPSKDRRRTGRKVKTKLFAEEKSKESISSDESKITAGIDGIAVSSTPMKNGVKVSDYPNLPSPVTPHSKSYERCDTPRTSHSHRHSRSQEKNCLGDYLVTAQKSSKKKKSRNASDDSEIKMDLDLSNSDIFPEIGARKSNSLRSEKRRIKPTNIDKNKKSLSLNSFSSDCFQQPSPLALEDNAVFRQEKLQPKELANSFDVERNLLKQERHKLMEKFNILNAESPKPSVMPQIKITQRDSFEKPQTFIKAESNKVMYKEKIDILVEIYDVLIKNNLILSMNTEIYFLISILLSKQYEDDYLDSESKLNDNNLTNYLLKIIHNSTYFAVKSLWYQRGVLEVILDKGSLKLLGENKMVRSFYPELAKFLLNSYGLKCEAETTQDQRVPEARSSNGVICFNQETDNADNFPNLLSFQNFKKQRDMFYEILRWYNDTQPTGGSRAALRGRVRALLAAGAGPANRAHLAALLVRHALAQCLPSPSAPASASASQESRLSKLQRRLTCPAAPPAPRLPAFTPAQLFYKEVIECAESECFRAHVRDAFASELCSLLAAPLAADERSCRHANIDLSKDYLHLSKKLCLLGKFLGFVTSLPYSHAPPEPKGGQRETYTPTTGVRETHYAVPKERVLENYISLRNYSQPTIDLTGILMNAYETSRLSLTIPWLAQYLSMLDYTSLRINYYQNLLKILFEIYVNRLKITDTHLKKNTVIFLKSTLSWLFALPHFPQDLFYEKSYLKPSVASDGVDCIDLVDESILFELCPYLRDVNVLLATCRVSQDQKDMGSFRHITPISLTLNPEERMRNKEKELQARLEEEFLKSQPASTRRVLELVTERVCAQGVRDLARARADCRLRAQAALRARAAHGDRARPLPSLEEALGEQLAAGRAPALQAACRAASARAGAALRALLPAPPAPAPPAGPPAAPAALAALAARHCASRLQRWLAHSWAGPALLCKDTEGDVRALLSHGLPPSPSPSPHDRARAALSPSPGLPPSPSPFPATRGTPLAAADRHASAAAALIDIKEQICLVLEGAATPELSRVLGRCAASCVPANAYCRAPTQRAMLQLSVDLCLVCVSRRPKEVTESFLSELHAVWDTCCPDRRRREPPPELRGLHADRAPSPPSPPRPPSPPSPPTPLREDEPQPIRKTNLRIIINNNISANPMRTPTTPSESTPAIEDSELLEYFQRVLCPRNIALLGSEPSSWAAMATVLVFLLRHDYLGEDSLTEQCLAVYRRDWPQSTLECLSRCMKTVSGAWSRSAGKFTLFLEFLAEYCSDMSPPGAD